MKGQAVKAVTKNDGHVVEVTVSRRNINRILELAEMDGRTPGMMRQGDPAKNEPTIFLVMQEDEEHYTDERYVGPERNGDATADLADAVIRMMRYLEMEGNEAYEGAYFWQDLNLILSTLAAD